MLVYNARESAFFGSFLQKLTFCKKPTIKVYCIASKYCVFRRRISISKLLTSGAPKLRFPLKGKLWCYLCLDCVSPDWFTPVFCNRIVGYLFSGYKVRHWLVVKASKLVDKTSRLYFRQKVDPSL